MVSYFLRFNSNRYWHLFSYPFSVIACDFCITLDRFLGDMSGSLINTTIAIIHLIIRYYLKANNKESEEKIVELE